MIHLLHATFMQVGLRHFDSPTPDRLAGALKAGNHTRHALAREPCERTGRRNAPGRPCLSAAAKALPPPAGHPGLDLPPAGDVPDPAVAPVVAPEDIPDTGPACAPEEVGPVPLDPVDTTAGRRSREAMMAARHPRGRARPPGGRMRHRIRPERHGVLGGIGFGSATRQLRARDEWTGWSADARAADIRRVIRNHRFLLLPGVRVHGLAPEIPRMAAPRVADDREARHSVRPPRPVPVSARSTVDTAATVRAGPSPGARATPTGGCGGASPARAGHG